jgi:glycyl-tRNA synthetase alpha chain
LFNVLDASGGIGVTERTAYILRVRQLAVAIARAYADGETGGTSDSLPQTAGGARSRLRPLAAAAQGQSESEEVLEPASFLKFKPVGDA